MDLTRRSLELLVPFFGLLYSGIFTLYVSFFESPPTSAANPFPLIADIFALIFFVSAFLVWRGKRVGYLISIPLSVVFILLFSSDLESALTGFADYHTFLESMIFIPVLFVTLAYSILGVRLVWRKEAEPKPRKKIPASSLIGTIVIGFVIGGALIGGLAAGVESRLLANSGSTADIIISQGASSSYDNSHTFSPSTFTVKAGTSVSWINKDTVTHTVTSQGSNLFDSGPMPTGATFSYRFAQPGNYTYYCTLHTFMIGKIVVTS